MKHEKKAKELVDKFYRYFGNSEIAKGNALICVDEIIDALPILVAGAGYGSSFFNNPQIDFWKEVKQEIEKL